MKLKIKTESGIDTVNGHKFIYYIEKKGIWFFYNDEPGYPMTITHVESGCKVCNVGYYTQTAFLDDKKAAAKHTLDKLIAQHGSSRVLQVINNAPKLSA